MINRETQHSIDPFSLSFIIFSRGSSLPSLHRSHFLILGQNIRQRTNRRNRKLINLLMRLGIVLLDMLKVRRIPERGQIPVQPPYPAVNSGVSGADIPNIALEVLHVHGVKADDRREQADISLGDGVAEEVWRDGGLLGEVGFDFVEGGEEGCYGLFVGFLGGCEAGFVDAVVDVVVDPFVGGVDVGAVGGWVEVDFLVLLWKQVVELVVEHADDFRALEGRWLDGCLLAEFKSLTSLLTIWPVFLSKRTGTVKRPV